MPLKMLTAFGVSIPSILVFGARFQIGHIAVAIESARPFADSLSACPQPDSSELCTQVAHKPVLSE